MTIKLNRRSKIGLGAAAIAVVAAGLPFAGTVQAAPLPPLTPSAGASVISPSTVKTSGTTFQLDVPSGATCPGDAVNNHRWNTYIVPAATDSSQLVFTAITGVPTGGAPGFAAPLKNPGGANIISQVSLGIGTGLIALPFGGVNLSLQAIPVPAGNYKIGIACTLNLGTGLGNEVTKFFETTTTVAASAGAGPQNFIWGNPAAPAAPVITTTSVTATSATVNFTQAAALPGVTGYTATVTPTSPAGPALAPIAVGAAATSFVVPGLTTNTVYSVTLTATNTSGTSPSSNLVSVTPSASAQPAVGPLSLTPGVGSVSIGIPAVALGGARTALPTSYDLAISPAPTTGPATINVPFVAGPISVPVPGITAGTPYTFTLTVNYAFPDSGLGSSIAGTSNNAQVIQQRITVVRPVGQLILTQRCGVNGAMPALAVDPGFPGFPSALPAVTASVDQVGTSPDITPNGVFPTGAGLLADAVTPDPQFANYPFPNPATYPTECGVNLGTATIVNTGPLAGQYYEANGFINEVTVSDARDLDTGWEVRGQMSNFVGTVSNTNIINGSYLGWTPYIQNTTPITGTGYLQTVTAGSQVLPGTGVVSGLGGLANGRRLSQAAPNLGLGVAQMDARLRLLIPTTANNDTYTGILNFTVLDNGNGTTP